VSQNPREVHFGLGTAARVDQVRVEWPGGHQLTLDKLDADRTLVVSPDQKDQISGGGSGCSL
jgi:ASPIC and UnbV